jgi:hypothetical protein
MGYRVHSRLVAKRKSSPLPWLFQPKAHHYTDSYPLSYGITTTEIELWISTSNSEPHNKNLNIAGGVMQHLKQNRVAIASYLNTS